MRWEHREAELERNVLTLEKQAAEISSAAEQVCIDSEFLTCSIISFYPHDSRQC